MASACAGNGNSSKVPESVSKPICCCHGQHERCGPDVSLLKPHLQREWDYEKNAYLGDIVIKPSSDNIVSWICDKSTADDPHCWDAMVDKRTRRTNCPYCAGVRVCKRNSLLTVAPELAKCWDFSKNKGTPGDYTAQSAYRAHWICSKCGHQSQTSIQVRVRNKGGCLVCSRKLRRVYKKHPTMAEAQHPLMAEWDHDRNAKQGWFPEKVTLGSAKQVHWVCHKCPKCIPHRWTKKVTDRALRAAGCPFCSGHSTCQCNSLPSLFPVVAQDWDNDKNQESAAQHTAFSSKLAWWHTTKRGSWQQIICERTTNAKRVASEKHS